jgi:hypothetical protein
MLLTLSATVQYSAECFAHSLAQNNIGPKVISRLAEAFAKLPNLTSVKYACMVDPDAAFARRALLLNLRH